MARRKVNPLAHIRALHGASTLTVKEQEAIKTPSQKALDSLRCGTGDQDDLAAINTMCIYMRMCAKLGVITDTDKYIEPAAQALQAINKRAHVNGKWQSPTLYAAEIEALLTMQDLFAYALTVVSVRECDKIARMLTTWAQNNRVGLRRAPKKHLA